MKDEYVGVARKRPRTAFSQDQVRCLESEFARNKYLTVSRRVELSRELGLTENQVRIVTTVSSTHELFLKLKI